MERVIAFEGGEGCGKGTAIEIAKKILVGKGYVVTVLGAIKDGPIAAVARERFLKQDMDLPTAAITKAAGILDVLNRAKQFTKLDKRNIVLLDRSFYSYSVYDALYFDNPFAKHILENMGLFDYDKDNKVEFALLITTDTNTCLERLSGRDDHKSFMDLKPKHEHDKINYLYQQEFSTYRFSKHIDFVDNNKDLQWLQFHLETVLESYKGTPQCSNI